MELRVEPAELAAAGFALSRLAAEGRDECDAVGVAVRRSVERLGVKHAGPALLGAWRELEAALSTVADGYGELGRGFSSLAPAYSSFDTHLVPK